MGKGARGRKRDGAACTPRCPSPVPSTHPSIERAVDGVQGEDEEGGGEGGGGVMASVEGGVFVWKEVKRRREGGGKKEKVLRKNCSVRSKAQRKLRS